MQKINAIALAVCLALTGCTRQSGEGIVVGKEHIPAVETATLPGGDGLPLADSRHSEPAPLPAGEKPLLAEGVQNAGSALHGSSPDPRALAQEQWIVKVQLVKDQRLLDVRAEQAQWEQLKPGDRVDVTYRAGQPSGLVWSAELK